MGYDWWIINKKQTKGETMSEYQVKRVENGYAVMSMGRASELTVWIAKDLKELTTVLTDLYKNPDKCEKCNSILKI